MCAVHRMVAHASLQQTLGTFLTAFCKGWGWARLNENTKGGLSCVLEYHAITAQGRTEVTLYKVGSRSCSAKGLQLSVMLV